VHQEWQDNKSLGEWILTQCGQKNKAAQEGSYSRRQLLKKAATQEGSYYSRRQLRKTSYYLQKPATTHKTSYLQNQLLLLAKPATRKTSYLQNQILAETARNKGKSQRQLKGKSLKRLVAKAARKGSSQNFKYSSKPQTATIFTPR
jgi:hypothetical protein